MRHRPRSLRDRAAVTAFSRRSASALAASPAERGHSVVAAPAVVEIRIRPLVRFLDKTRGKHPLQASVEGAGSQLKGVAGLPSDILHDGVTVPLPVGESDQNMEDRCGERKRLHNYIRYGTSVADIMSSGKTGDRLWFRFRIVIGIGHGMRVRRRFVRASQIFLKTNFAIAAVAACRALFAKVISAGILGALHADSGGLFFADAAHKGHGGYHWVRLFVFGFSAGCRDRVARQRCASLSTTAYC